MCGIAGHFGPPVSPETRARMLAALVSRGPDSQHVRVFDAVGVPGRECDSAMAGLVHARLSIIDPRPVADQPMGSDDGKVWICYNGEVYGWQQDAEVLRARGAHFRSRCDTEFILHAYEHWGIEGMLPRLRGMFAFAIVDFRTRRVHLVRDRLGLKPLVYAFRRGGLAFGSTVRSVLPWLSRADRSLSESSIDAFLAHRYVPAPRTIFTHLARLPNGHRLEYALDSGNAKVHRYWVPTPVEGQDCARLLDEAIELRLATDRPICLFLSGGVDSALVASRLAATGHNGLPSFTAAFGDPRFDESADAQATARALEFSNTRIDIPVSMRQDFAQIVSALDEPFADPAAFPTWHLARAAAATAKVVLGGDGGDELFAGYKRFAIHMRNRWRGAMRIGVPVLADPRPSGWRKTLSEMRVPWEIAYALRTSGFSPNQRLYLQPGVPPRRSSYWRDPDFDGATSVERLLAWDFANYLPEYVLRKADLCTMAHGLELRAPLLDHRFVEAVFALPAAIRFTQPPKRYLATLAPQLDRLGVLERKKRGFNPPLDRWLRDDFRERLPALGASLASLTSGQLDSLRVTSMLERTMRLPALGEQALSLIVLEESLRQLAAEATRGE